MLSFWISSLSLSFSKRNSSLYKIKSFNDYYANGKNNSQATKVESRTETVSGGQCTLNNTIADRANFDTNSTYFYYDSQNQKTDAILITNVENVKVNIPLLAGAENYCS